MPSYDAIVIGSGPNGLAAAITLARAGAKTLILEAKSSIGGGLRTLPLTLPGYHHDMCAAAHPLVRASPFFKSLPLEQYGVRWAFSPVEVAHPLDDGPAILIRRSVTETAAQFGPDSAAYQRIFGPLTAAAPALIDQFLGPLFPLRVPRRPLSVLYFAALALQSARGMAARNFADPRTRAAFAGMAAHSLIPLEQPATAAFGLILGILAHAVGWPLAVGGSGRIAEGMAAYFRSLGGEIITDHEVRHWREIPSARAVLFDTSPRALIRIVGDYLPVAYRAEVERYRYGPGVFKLDYALSAPVPWRDPAVAGAGTVHLGGGMDDIRAGERDVWQGRLPARPYVLLIQPTLFDPRRAPEGKHTLWAYCHAPHGSHADLTAAVEAQIERFAPGFREVILHRTTHTAAQMEAYNPNYVGGDINSGVQDLRQLFTRPAVRINPYRVPSTTEAAVYICSSATPPGGGVHGMGGYYAAKSALRAL